MDTAYHPDFGAKVAYTFDRMPDDPDAQVRQSMAKAICLIRKDAESELIQNDAATATRGGDPNSDCGQQISGIWKYIKPHLKFKQDVDIANDLELDPETKKRWNVGDDTVEVFIRPADQSLLIALRGMGVEDCDGFTMYGACLLTAMGIPCALVTVAADKERPREFSHVYVAAWYQGRRIALDFSHGSTPGWECPHTRIREWPVWETPIEKVSNGLLPVAFAGALYGLIRYFNRRRRV